MIDPGGKHSDRSPTNWFQKLGKGEVPKLSSQTRFWGRGKRGNSQQGERYNSMKRRTSGGRGVSIGKDKMSKAVNDWEKMQRKDLQSSNTIQEGDQTSGRPTGRGALKEKEKILGLPVSNPTRAIVVGITPSIA